MCHVSIVSFTQVLNMQPCEVLSLFRNATGHSQGIVSAVVVASSLDTQSFFANSERALKLLFWMGTRVQLAYPQTTLAPAILADSLDHDEGIPTPMLAVAHLPSEVCGLMRVACALVCVRVVITVCCFCGSGQSIRAALWNQHTAGGKGCLAGVQLTRVHRAWLGIFACRRSLSVHNVKAYIV